MRRNKKEELLGYEIKIIPDKESGYLAVRFPDLPGIITGGYRPEEAVKNAQEALDLGITSHIGLPIFSLKLTPEISVNI